MEGKEVRFGIVSSALFATVTTAASCGAVNAMHDSFTPLGGLVAMALMQTGEGDRLVVADVLRPGYTLRGRVIRPAGVRVNRE